jgi:hypothetical protein
MESCFIVDTKSFYFSMLKGLAVLRVEEKRKEFSGVALLGMRCTAWVAVDGGRGIAKS